MHLKECDREAGAQALSPRKAGRGVTRRTLLKLPMAERRRILAQQAEALAAHYQADTQWQDTEVQDLRES